MTLSGSLIPFCNMKQPGLLIYHWTRAGEIADAEIDHSRQHIPESS